MRNYQSSTRDVRDLRHPASRRLGKGGGGGYTERESAESKEGATDSYKQMVSPGCAAAGRGRNTIRSGNRTRTHRTTVAEKSEAGGRGVRTNLG